MLAVQSHAQMETLIEAALHEGGGCQHAQITTRGSVMECVSNAAAKMDSRHSFLCLKQEVHKILSLLTASYRFWILYW